MCVWVCVCVFTKDKFQTCHISASLCQLLHESRNAVGNHARELLNYRKGHIRPWHPTDGSQSVRSTEGQRGVAHLLQYEQVWDRWISGVLTETPPV